MNASQDTMKKLFRDKYDCTMYHDEDGLTIYFYASANPCIVAWKGKASKPELHQAYINNDMRKLAADNLITMYKERKQAQAQRRAERSKPHSLKVGDILYSSWGYDQTNVDYYEVVGLKGKGVLIRQIASHGITTGFMCGRCEPIKGKYIGELVTYHIPTKDNHIKVNSTCYYRGEEASAKYRHQYAWPWDGQSKYTSWYA